MSASSKSNTKLGIWGILKLLSPLLFLIIPIALILINHWLIAEHYPDVSKWIDYFAYGLCAVIVLWVAIRLGVFFSGVLQIWRHDREIQRSDPLFVIETKMRSRLKDVHGRLKRIDKRMYDVPLYAVIGQKKSEVESLLMGSGISFPKDLNVRPKSERHEDYEEWYIGADAVFVDVTSLQAPQNRDAWKIFLKVISRNRPAAPVNGVLLVLPSEHVRSEDSRSRREYESAIMKNLQRMQERLQEKFPVYLLISDLDKMPGFDAFFSELNEIERGQILGWSLKGSHRKTLDLGILREERRRIESRMETLMLRKMAEQRKPQDVDQIYTFATNFNVLLKRVIAFIGRIFDPDAYLEPVALRGFYFYGGIADSNRPSFASNEMVGRQTVVGNGRSMEVDASTIVGKGVSLKSMVGPQSWFCRDFFQKKLLPESGAISRPAWVKKKQTVIKVTGAVILTIQLFLLAGLMISEAGKSSDWRDESARIVQRASLLLEKKVPTQQDKLLARQILDDILRIQNGLKAQGLFKNATSIGLGGELNSKLSQLHARIYREFFLQPLIQKVESDISRWDGVEKNFVHFGSKLTEYVRWSNPKYQGKLSIEPFVSRDKDALSTKHRNFLLRHFIQDTTEALPRMTDNKALARISKALEKINGSTRVTVPLETGQKSRHPGESEWEWWQRLSVKLSGFSGTTQKLLDVASPFENRGNKSINDQIYYATKMVGQLMSSILEMEGLIEEGRKKFPTWICSLNKFFPDMKKAAVEWPPILDVIDKSEMRSEFAYDKVVVPFLNKEMAWAQTFIGLNGDKLTSVLDNLVDRKTRVGDRQVTIYREIGQKYLTFLKSFNGYLNGFGELIKKSGALVSYSTYYSGEELMAKLETVRKDLTALNELEKKAMASASVLDSILEEIAKKEAEGDTGELKVKDGVKKNAKKMGKSLLKDAISGVELKKQVLNRFYWTQFSSWLGKWLPGLRIEKAYLVSLYWMELFDWFKPFTKNQMKGGSYASILRMNLFLNKNAQFFTVDIEKFLDGWLASIPTEILALLKEEGVLQKNPGLKDFEVLYNQVQKFRDQYLSELRAAAASFVSAVNLMEPDVQKTWKKITENSEPELNWDALEAFTKFKNEYEIKEGIALRNITGSLEEVQIALSKTLNGELGKKFDAAWKAVVNKLKVKDTHTKFPFARGGPSASKSEALRALSEFVELGVSLGVIQAEDGTSIEHTGQSQKIMDRIVPTVRRKFIEKCAVYKSFLGGEMGQMPELVVDLLPGDIGKHYHWIRMFIGRLRYYDLSVYGEKPVSIDLASTVGSVKFMGLDVEKSALAQQTVTRGDLGLLQLVYTNGRSMDKEKMKWRVTSSLGSASSDGVQVPFELVFSFTKSVPPLPILPE